MMNFKRIAFKISVLISTAYAVIMLLHWPIGFTFFTQLSNIYAAAVVLLQQISRKKYPLLKYSATRNSDGKRSIFCMPSSRQSAI